MKKLLVFLALVISLAFTATAVAGSPHFIKSAFSLTTTSNSITVAGKEAGLGGETITVTVTATAECTNGGGNHPQAANKEEISKSGVFDVHNGQATFSLTATTSLNCQPPMTVNFTNVTVTDDTNGLTFTF